MSQTPSNPNQPPYQQPQGQPFPYQGNMPPPQGYSVPPQRGFVEQKYEFPVQAVAVPPKKRRGRTLLIGAVVLVVALALCGVIGTALTHSATAVTSSTASTKIGNVTQATPTPAPTQASTYKIGDIVSAGVWNVTLNNVKTSPGSSYVTPKDGNTFLVLNISMKNKSATTQTVSSILLFTLRGDDGTKYDITIYPDAGSQIDGNVDAGQPAKGVIVYEVPANTKTFHFKFAPDIIDTSAPSANWTLTV